MDWQIFWHIFDKLAASPPVAAGDDVEGIYRAYLKFGIDLRDPVQLYVTFEELSDNADMILGQLSLYRGDLVLELLGQIFADACEWMTRELWLFVPEEVRSKLVTALPEVPLESHVEGLRWRMMTSHAIQMRRNYVLMRPSGADFEADERKLEELGVKYRRGMSEPEVKLRAFISMYTLLRLEVLFHEFLRANKLFGIDTDKVKIVLAARFQIVFHILPAEFRPGYGQG